MWQSHMRMRILWIRVDGRSGGLTVHPGDLIHGDRHGILSIPLEIAAEIPAVAARILEMEKSIVSLCQSPRFSLEKLRALLKELTEPERK